MVVLNVEKLLKEKGKSKEWLCNEMDISHFNLNKALKTGRSSISYKYLERILQSTWLYIRPVNVSSRGQERLIIFSKN